MLPFISTNGLEERSGQWKTPILSALLHLSMHKEPAWLQTGLHDFKQASMIVTSFRQRGRDLPKTSLDVSLAGKRLTLPPLVQ